MTEKKKVAPDKKASKILSLAMRPRALSSLYGQDALVQAIRNHVKTRPPQTWMFHGASGCGKTTVMRILSVAYQCEHMKIWGDPCQECWERRDGFAIHEINGADNTGVDEVRKLVDLSRYKPTSGLKRVFLVDEAHKLSNSAVSLLLKPLEEPPASTIWILGTSEAGKILSAMKRRPVSYQLKSLNMTAAEKFLAHYAKRAGVARPLDPLVEQCHLMGLGSPGFLLQALEKYAAGASASEAAAGVDSSVETLRICKAVTAGDWKTVCANLKSVAPDEARMVRDSVAGWLRGILQRESNPRLADRAATSLLELCSAPIDDATMLRWLWAVLWKVSRRYADR